MSRKSFGDNFCLNKVLKDPRSKFLIHPTWSQFVLIRGILEITLYLKWPLKEPRSQFPFRLPWILELIPFNPAPTRLWHVMYNYSDKKYHCLLGIGLIKGLLEITLYLKWPLKEPRSQFPLHPPWMFVLLLSFAPLMRATAAPASVRVTSILSSVYRGITLHNDFSIHLISYFYSR